MDGDLSCGCEPDPGSAGHVRDCDYCGRTFLARRCIHHPHQDPCPECAVLPVPQLG